MRWPILVALWLAACSDVAFDGDGDGVPISIDCDDADSDVGVRTWFVDHDGDGFGAHEVAACTRPVGAAAAPGDCDDGNPTVYPGAEERCDGLDNDCTGVADDAEVGPADLDGDGYGDLDHEISSCVGALADGGGDCDDADPAVNAGAEELCNGKDDDCDGAVDEPPADAPHWFYDGDGDGWGGAEYEGCEPPPGSVAVGGDCDDGRGETWPGAPESCDARDNDCDGVVDEDPIDVVTWHLDDDGDGYGGRDVTAVACDAPPRFVADGSDCDDADPDVYPGAPETCDARDQDCDGDVDVGAVDEIAWYLDRDGDGLGDDDAFTLACDPPYEDRVSTAGDCDDERADVGTGFPEVCDGADNDCDGLIDEDDADLSDAVLAYDDADGDGYGGSGGWSCFPPPWTVMFGGDCDDADADVFPGAVEVCNGVDGDCDGVVGGAEALGAAPWFADRDADGWGDDAAVRWACDGVSGEVDRSGDCDDGDSAVHPLAVEACDGVVDLDCDGVAGGGDGDGDGFASCEDCDDTDPDVYPLATERCDGVDQDCDGEVDEDAAGGPSWGAYPDVDGDGYGRDDVWIAWCEGPAPPGYAATPGDCDDADADVFPGAVERCNAGDDDCDGVVPAEEADADGDGEGPLACGGTDCDDARADVAAGLPEVCGDGVDNDCDGIVDPCGLEGERLVSSAEASWRGFASVDKLGHAVAVAGDVDGDGTVDLLLGAPQADEGGSGSGSVYVLFGPHLPGARTDVAAAAGATLTGANRFQWAGYALAGAGDVNDDGLDDVLVGAPNDNTHGWWSGVAYLVLGPVSGTVPLGTADAIFVGIGGNTRAGDAVGGGDLDGDGFADVVVTSWATGLGGACVWPGPVTGVHPYMRAGPACVVGAVHDDGFGSAVHVGGDTNGDGLPDLLVGAMGRDGGRGAVTLWTGLPPGHVTLIEATAVLAGVGADDHASAVASAGDVDGDGYDDVIVGAPYNDASGTDAGAAYLVRGPVEGTRLLETADATLLGEAAGDRAGWSVAGAGDVDADGAVDLAVGASRAAGAVADTGAVFVVRGPIAGTLRVGDAYGRVRGETAGGGLAPVAAPGDLDGDGTSELLVGEPDGDGLVGREGVVYLLWGGPP